MKTSHSRPYGLLADIVKTATSKERLKQLFHTPLYSNAFYLMMANAANALLGFAFWMAAARLYPTEAVGLASAAIAAIGLLALLSTLGLDYGLVRFLPHSGDKARDMINSCLTISGLISIALALIFIAGLGIWSPGLLLIREHPIFFAAFIFFTLIFTFQSFVNQAFIAKRRAGFVLAQGLIFGLLRFIPLYILASLFHTFGIFASLGVAVSIAVVIAIILFVPRVEKDYRPFPVINKGAVNEMMHFSFANYAASIFWILPQFILPLMVVNLLGAEQNAYFYIAWSIAGLLSTVAMSTSYSLFAEGSYDEETLGQNIRRSLKLVLALLIPAIILVFLIGDKVLLLFGRAYSENATTLLWILATSALPLSINYIYFGVKRVQKEMKNVIWLSALVAVGTLGLSWVLLPRMGIRGGGVAWLVSQGITALIIVYNLWRPIKQLQGGIHA